ncbi:MAG TPA: hypothetical protein VEY67_10095 [Candidatus Dormibacteraeota bacterium]|nr:hypothetical protein [Candidatus Dormibacteraeota bacterium]
MGWGVVHGTAFSADVIVVCVGLILAERRGPIVRDTLISIVIGVVVAVVLGLDLTNAGWTRLADAAAPSSLAPEWRVLAVAVAGSAVVLGVLGLVVGAIRGGLGGLIGGLVAGVILGALVGAFTAITFGLQVGVALGLLVALLAFAVLQGAGIARRGVDAASFKARFFPTQTIETAKETLEWLKAQSPARRR